MSKERYDFANILFSGPCNLRCPYCIGKEIDQGLNIDNLGEFPLRNLETFIWLLREDRVNQIAITGTNTDPQLYRYEDRLIRYLRQELPEAKLSLHTNGQLAVRKMSTFNLYDRVSLSLPSFNPDIYRAMTGVGRVPDLEQILRLASVPVKISCVINEFNVNDLPNFLYECRRLSIKRLALRQLYGDSRVWELPSGLVPVGEFCGNPVYDYFGMEITYWNFELAESRSINLFSDGTVSHEYLLASVGKGKGED